MFYKKLYVFDRAKPVKAIIRQYSEKDFESLIQVQMEAFPPPFPSKLWWNREQLYNHISLFPEGALCVEVDGKIVGSMTGLIVNYNPGNPDHNWADITDNVSATISLMEIRYTSLIFVLVLLTENWGWGNG